ncbi:Transcriptional adapter ada2 [Rhizophlyctis rosea]|uniref:Transcriptional adapter ada2 n=1 Tax=Rhizophlyctis rosea TaxID=64517 RepID=A0AAD5X5I3_9FUNG|nr:Transcriptional adapter ada2 [Rhizophlyctis rosea]
MTSRSHREGHRERDREPKRRKPSDFDSEVKEDFIIKVDGADGSGALGARPMTRRALATLKGGKPPPTTYYGRYGRGMGFGLQRRASGGERGDSERDSDTMEVDTPTSDAPAPAKYMRTNHAFSIPTAASTSYLSNTTAPTTRITDPQRDTGHEPVTQPAALRRRSSIANGAPGVPSIEADIDWENYMDTRGAPEVVWKGTPSNLATGMDGNLHRLTREEVRTCAVLRLTPTQYLHIKATFLSAAKTRGSFRKKDAQRWFKMDVNKTCILYDWFLALGWIPSPEKRQSLQNQPLPSETVDMESARAVF